MKRVIGEILLVFIFYLLQVSFGMAIAIGGIKPNFLILLPILIGFLKGQEHGMFTGFLAGIMYDLFSTGLLGVSALFFVLIGFISGIFTKEYEEYEIVIPIGLVFLGDFIFELISYVLNFLLHNRLDAGYFIVRFILPEVLYTVVLAIVIYKPFAFLNKKLETVEKRSMNKID